MTSGGRVESPKRVPEAVGFDIGPPNNALRVHLPAFLPVVDAIHRAPLFRAVSPDEKILGDPLLAPAMLERCVRSNGVPIVTAAGAGRWKKIDEIASSSSHGRIYGVRRARSNNWRAEMAERVN